jgi:hypothetical protein
MLLSHNHKVGSSLPGVEGKSEGNAGLRTYRVLRLEGGDLILGPTMPTILTQLGAFDADRGIVFTNAILKSKCQQDANHGENITRHPRPVGVAFHNSLDVMTLKASNGELAILG